MSRVVTSVPTIFPPRSFAGLIARQHKRTFHATMATAKEQKSQLRKRIGGVLSNLSRGEVERQSMIAQNLILATPEFQEARRVGVYLCMPSAEAQTYALVRAALGANKKVFVPFLHDESLLRNSAAEDPIEDGVSKRKKKKAMSMLHLSSLTEYESLSSDSWGIPSLSSDDVGSKANAMGGQGLQVEEHHDFMEGLDLIVMPGVAFDVRMNRLGHGAGFYDRFLARYCGSDRRKRPFLGMFLHTESFRLTWSILADLGSGSLSCRTDAAFQ